MLDTVEIENGTGAGLYEKVKEVLSSKNIPINNIIGLGSDNCATMIGGSNGFKAHMLKDLPSFFVLGCICHSFALCANHAAERIPSRLETFLKDITSYFCRSSKR